MDLLTAQPILGNLGGRLLDWLCYLAGKFQTAPNLFVFNFPTLRRFGCHLDATEQQRALNFELVVSDRLSQ